MAQTVIGIFDSANDAQEAVRRMEKTGISRESVDVVNRTSTDTERNDEDTGVGESISNFFSSLFGNDDEARNYSEVAKRGYTVTVHARSSEEAERAAEIMDDTGAVDVDERASQYRASGYSDRNRSEGKMNYTDQENDVTNRSIPVIEENLEVGKREVESGGARIHSRIVEKPVEETIRLRSEKVNVERNPVNRPASEADMNTFKEGSIEVTEHKEVPVVNKEARVVEEVSIKKDVEENEETIRDTVKKTEVDVERLNEEERLRRESDTDRDRNV